MCKVQGAKCSLKRFEGLLYSGVVCEKVRGFERFEGLLYSGVVCGKVRGFVVFGSGVWKGSRVCCIREWSLES